MQSSPDPIKLLVIGSDFERLSEMFDVFERSGFGLAFASGGREGLRAMRMERPDMVLCEMGLHDMTGLDVCRAIRTDARLGEVCFVMIAKSYHNAQNILDAMAAGADDCLTERSLLTHLVAKIVWMMSKRRLEQKQRADHPILRSRQTQLAGLLKDAATMLQELNRTCSSEPPAELIGSIAGLLDEQVTVLEKLGAGNSPGCPAAYATTIEYDRHQAM